MEDSFGGVKSCFILFLNLGDVIRDLLSWSVDLIQETEERGFLAAVADLQILGSSKFIASFLKVIFKAETAPVEASQGDYMLRPSAPSLTRASGVQAQMEKPRSNIFTDTYDFPDVALCAGTETLV
ncbi:uncharacterized protein PHALS_02889 [Plasmopara halstedii]|uniref:Uncharacterized protein n=1 Tax=Plasmopara halstedii TaxID=4781 RepID=A0A0P1AY53_PLAHL|nr:uncharacterized protein PHALS_02889 [Plasmopara halstedii]CEG46489.1 hypothetical protein PHALS_02889 [Plasmopara halstedii]|eukprot:XP_024582858.1 hypothetical protein PHALS_02889 [Plasmopara halstedii]